MSDITIFSGAWPAIEGEAQHPTHPPTLTPQQRAVFDRECNRLRDERLYGNVSIVFADGAAKNLQVTRTLKWQEDAVLAEAIRRIIDDTGYGSVGIEVIDGARYLKITTSIRL